MFLHADGVSLTTDWTINILTICVAIVMAYQHFQLPLNNGRLDIKLDEVYKKLKLGSQSTGVMLDVTAACMHCEVYESNVITLNNKYKVNTYCNI